MYMISSRFDFWNPDKTAGKDEIREIDLGSTTTIATPGLDAFLEEITRKKVLLIVHGYNNDVNDVCRAYSIIEHKVHTLNEGKYDQVIGYTWPGGDKFFEYGPAKNRATAVAPRIRNWIKLLSEKVTSLDVMTHSMGTYATLSALHYELTFEGVNPLIRNFYTMAGAVDNESLEIQQKYYNASRMCQRVFVFHSQRDPVLKTGYLTYERDLALGLTGPENPAAIMKDSKHVRVVNCKNEIREHGGYKDCDALYKYLDGVLAGGKVAQFVTL